MMCRNYRLGAGRRALRMVLAVVLFGAAACQRNTENFAPSGSHEVKMVVLKGPADATMALVPVFIDGKGPYSFALDTGASRTTVDRKVAEELALPAAGGETQVSGVGGKAAARPVRVKSWRVAETDLPATTIDALDLSDRTTGLQGLLGSDILSKFQVIHVDYKNQRLIFHPGPSGQLAASP